MKVRPWLLLALVVLGMVSCGIASAACGFDANLFDTNGQPVPWKSGDVGAAPSSCAAVQASLNGETGFTCTAPGPGGAQYGGLVTGDGITYSWYGNSAGSSCPPPTEVQPPEDPASAPGGTTAQDYARIGVDAPTILLVWSWGFGAVFFFWTLGLAIGAGKGVIRKV